MDNDIKIAKNQTNSKTHEEVLLFLNDELQHIQQTSELQSYNLEEEYAKTKKHKSPFTYIVLAICFLCVGGIALIMNAVISKHNSEIAVNLQVFDDLNLRTLLDSVSKVQNSYDDAVQRKLAVVSKMEQELAQVQAQKDNEIFLLDSLKVPEKEKEKRIAEIENEYKVQTSAVHQEYDSQILTIESEIDTFADQLAEFDNAKVESAREQEKAFEAERQIYEMEKLKIKNDYELRLNDLNSSMSDMQKKHDEELRNSINQLNTVHKLELSTYDPVIKDDVAAAIVAANKKVVEVENITEESESADGAEVKEENAGFSANVISEKGLYSNSKVEDSLQTYLEYYSDYSYLDSKYKNLPYKNSVVEYRNASNSIVDKMGNFFAETTSEFAKENDNLKAEIVDYKEQIATAEKTLDDEYVWFGDCLEGILDFAKTNAVVLQVNAEDDIAIYVAKKARYLIPAEEGLGAEIRTEQTVKGRIYREVYEGEEDDYFYFVPSLDKDGNPVEIDFSTILPGTAVKLLSK